MKHSHLNTSLIIPSCNGWLCEVYQTKDGIPVKEKGCLWELRAKKETFVRDGARSISSTFKRGEKRKLVTYSWAFSRRAIGDPVSKSVARMERSLEPVIIAELKCT
jgi:hypothetical protein